MIISPTPCAISRTVLIDDSTIPTVSTIKYLGVDIDSKFTFAEHTNAICAKGKKCIGALFRTVGQWVGRQYFANLYISVVLPILLYAIPVTCPKNKYSWIALERVNKFAAKLISNDYRSNYASLLVKTRLKTIAELYLVRTLHLCFKYVYGFRCLHKEISILISITKYNLRHKPPHDLQITVPKFSRVMCDNLPIFRVFNLWNCIPDPNLVLCKFSAFRVKLSGVFNHILSKFDFLNAFREL
jgi:hypothetical protein